MAKIKRSNAAERLEGGWRNARKLLWAHRATVISIRGLRGSLFDEIYTAALLGSVLPKWARAAITKAGDTGIWSWDELLGPPPGKLENLRKLGIQRKLIGSLKIWERISELREIDPQFPLDEKSFESVGSEFGVSGGTCRRYYYEIENKLLSILNGKFEDNAGLFVHQNWKPPEA
jgi:hypothetical protein